MKNRAISRRRFLNISGVGVAGFAFYSNTLLAQASGRDNKFVIAETQFGKIRGIEKKSVKIFKGIPYGANTTGTNRFMPPVDPAGWTGVRDALNYGHNCSQNNPASPPKPFQADPPLSLIHISEPTRLGMISYAVFCLKKKKTTNI